jgi:hypothetical protein
MHNPCGGQRWQAPVAGAPPNLACWAGVSWLRPPARLLLLLVVEVGMLLLLA